MSLTYIHTCITETLLRYNRYTLDRYILILNTGLAETGYNFPPTDGYWQLEYETVKDIIVNVLPNIKDKASYFDMLLIKEYTPELHTQCMSSLSKEALSFQIRMVDLKYRTDPFPLPAYYDITGQATYWKQVYNTNKGAGTIAHFIKEATSKM